MPILSLTTIIESPIHRVFDLSRSIDLHLGSQSKHREKVFAGRASGLLSLGEEVTWSAIHLGIRQTLQTRITRMEEPRYFRDSQVTGAFKRFDHDHFFEYEAGKTIMRDAFDFTSPMGWLGRFVDRLFLKSYMTQLLQERNQMIKRVAETALWERFLPRS